MHASQGFEKKKRKFVDKQAYLLIKTRILSLFTDKIRRFIEGQSHDPAVYKGFVNHRESLCPRCLKRIQRLVILLTNRCRTFRILAEKIR